MHSFILWFYSCSGSGSQSLGAAVAAMQGDNVRGVVRLVQVDPATCVIEGTIDGLLPGTHGLYVHELGDISSGCARYCIADTCSDARTTPSHCIITHARNRHERTYWFTNNTCSHRTCTIKLDDVLLYFIKRSCYYVRSVFIITDATTCDPFFLFLLVALW